MAPAVSPAVLAAPPPAGPIAPGSDRVIAGKAYTATVAGMADFVSCEGLPSDFCLTLVGKATRMIHGDIAPGNERLIGH